MSYSIKHYSGTLLTTVADGTVDTSTDLTLIGKNYAGYGQAQNDNFVWLLENFANPTQPPNPLAGQIWYDSANKKLKFWDSANWRIAGSAEIGSSQPTGLTTGDFWYNTVSNQLYVYNGSTPVLIGPQEVSNFPGATQMQSVSVLDRDNIPHPIIQAVVNGHVTFTIAGSDAPFALNTSTNHDLIQDGFDYIQSGITLAYTLNATGGVTSGSDRLWGTAKNADMLGGIPAANYVQAGNATFSTLVNFSDAGFTVGNPVAKLSVFNASQTTPTIQNTYGSTIVFETNVSGSTKTPLVINGNDITPGLSGVSNLGTGSLQWATVYASYFNGTGKQSDALNLNSAYVQASTAAAANTIVGRDSSANINANLFQGTATSAQYADLAEKYLADADYEVGTVVMVGGEKEVTQCSSLNRALGVVSGNPAFMMNKDLVGGTYIALKGRVPVKVWGPCSKGDMMTAFKFGTAHTSNTDDPDWTVFAIALEDNDDTGIKLVECVIL
jgi:hypothetical protein